MRVFFDTNIVLRLENRSDALHGMVAEATQNLVTRGDQPCVAPQVLIEFWAVATRPVNARGFGWTTKRTELEFEKLLTQFEVLESTVAVFSRWRQLVVEYGVSGKQVHDTHIAAAIIEHSVTHLLTLNPDDFKRFPDIEVIHPSELQA